MTERRSDHRLRQALEDHGAEGVEILVSEPSRLIRVMLLLFFGMLLLAAGWAFIGRADVTVTAQGVLGPESDERRIYSPVDGELVDVYVDEGIPVSKGDVIARINSVNAIELATRAMEAKLKLSDAQAQYDLLPERKKVLSQELDLLEVQIEAAEAEHEKRLTEANAKLAEEERIRLQKTRARLDEARRQMDFAGAAYEKFLRLFQSPGGGGVSRQQVQERQREYSDRKTDYELARTELAQFEVDLNKEYQQRNAETRKKSQELLSLRAQYEQKRLERDNLEHQLQSQLQIAKATYEGAARVTFDDIDENNFLLVRAPVSGVVTRLEVTQPGDKVSAAKPIASIAPAGSRTVLNVQIEERDRAFLREGMPAKIKFAAFPYQRFGFVEGRLDYIAPTAKANPETRQLAYEAHVALQRDYFPVERTQVPLRYGMTGVAEIVVRKRRLIDMALDPLRNATAW